MVRDWAISLPDWVDARATTASNDIGYCTSIPVSEPPSPSHSPSQRASPDRRCCWENRGISPSHSQHRNARRTARSGDKGLRRIADGSDAASQTNVRVSMELVADLLAEDTKRDRLD
jgi:hypothetical protein